MLPSFDTLQNLARKMAEKFPQVHKVILFGSHARGEAGPDSDVDLMVLMDFEGHSVDQSATLRLAFPEIDFPVDLLVRTPDKFQQRCQMNDWFIREVRDQGKVLYEA
jgi:uncharacterized protein